MESIFSDLAIGLPIVKGQNYPVRNCWHFSTDGTTRDVLFRDRDDFVAAIILRRNKSHGWLVCTWKKLNLS
jgi:hypothetical protein